MIKIDEKYDVVLTYSPISEITGHVFECFDYYLFLRQFCNVGIVFFNGLPKEKLKIAWNSKYIVPFTEVENNLILVDIAPYHSYIVQFGKNTKVILADGNLKALEKYNIILYTKHLFGFMSREDVCIGAKLNTGITYLQDYRIYGKNKYYKSFDYVKKLPFKFYKKSTKVFDNTGLIYMTYNCRRISPDAVEYYHKLSKCNKTYLAVPYKLQAYNSIDGVVQIEVPIDDFFNKFDIYIYTPVNVKFDCSPRLVTECFMQGKKVIKELNYYDVGLETRYNDCINNLESLNLTENDNILALLDS